MESSPILKAAEEPIDPSHPFKGVVVCCTSIPPEQRTDLAARTAELGGIHKYDLTPDVTHLVVGDYDTPKYRHVAKERPDVKSMDVAWIDAVVELWKNDLDIDFAALEKRWQLMPLETSGRREGEEKRGSLLCCMTGFDDPQERQQIIEKITTNGARYTGDLTKHVTHLLVRKPEGKKYAAAKTWGVHTVSIEWLNQSVERGLILDERYFDPTLPPEQRGVGAWTRIDPRRISLGKRPRSTANAPEEGQRKLRKTASMKLSSQRDALWGDIMVNQKAAEPNPIKQEDDNVEVRNSSLDLAAKHAAQDAGIFSTCYFYLPGFGEWEARVLSDTIAGLGGKICGTIDEVALRQDPIRREHRYLIVAQDSQPDAHFQIPTLYVNDVEIVTEFFIEKCIHKNTLFNPNDHVLGRPFPLFPIPGFDNLSICTAGFTGIELLHIEKSISQLGAKFASRLNETASLIVCKSLGDIRREKLRLALEYRTPVISAEWLWECISTGYSTPIAKYLYPELRQDPEIQPKPRPKHEVPRQERKQIQRSRSEHGPKVPNGAMPAPPRAARVDATAFDNPSPLIVVEAGKMGTKDDSTASMYFQTAKTHQQDSFGGGTVSAPLSDKSASAMNKSPSPQKTAKHARRKSTSTSGEDQTGSEAPNDDSNGSDANDTAGPTAEEIEAAIRRQREADKAAERTTLTSKLTSLIVPTPTTNLSENSPQEEDPGHTVTSIASNRLARKKRGILGRAVSNVSTTSNGSIESGAGAKGTSFTGIRDDRPNLLGRTMSEGQVSEEPVPPSTQIQYEDPKEKQHKAALLSKMRGVEASMTLADTTEMPIVGAVESSAKVTRTSGRQTRRR